MRILTALLFICFSQHALSQVTGQVVDENGQPLPQAAVALYQDSTLVTGNSADLEGNFSIKAPAGTYQLQVSFVSYQKYRKSVELKQNEKLDIGTVKMQPASTSLSEVTVEGKSRMMEFKHDKRVFNVSKDLVNAGSNASNILNNLPSVTVGVEGDVSLRGSQNVRILVNGKPSGLIGNDPATALRQLQANMIERIEVITNPSARYDAEGEAGIINIVLKKQEKAGLNGSVNAQVGYPELYGAGAALNYRKNKFNFFTNLSFNYNKSPGRGSSDQQFDQGDTTYSFLRDRSQLRGGLDMTLRGGADYSIDEENSLTGSFIYSPSRDKNLAELRYRDFDANGDLVQIVNREDRETEIEETLEGNLNWTRNYKDFEDHKWTADLTFTQELDGEESEITQDTVDRAGMLEQRVDNQENQRRIVAQTDYVHPFSEDVNFETGFRATMREIENDYALSNVDENGDLIPVDEFTNAFTFIENVYAGYFIYNGQLGDDITYQLGLRSELTDITTKLDTSSANQRDYFNFFPSVNFTYEFNPRNDLQLSYSRRISRPGFWTLAPFFGFSDNRNFYSGNPNVNPEFTDSYQAGFLHYFETGSLYSGIYHRHRTGVIERIRTVDAEGFTRIFPVNLSVENNYGFEFNFQLEPLDWYEVTADLNLFYSRTDGEYEGQVFDASTFTSSGRVSNRFEVWNSDLQLSFNFRGPARTTQGRRLGRYTMDLGWSKELFDERATLNLSVRDLFNTRYRRSYTRGDNFTTYSKFQWRERQTTLSFTWRIDKRKGSKKTDLRR